MKKTFRILESKKFKVVRGKRISTIIEATYSELEKGTMTFKPQTKKRQYDVDSMTVRNIKIMTGVERGAGIVTFYGTIQGNTNTYESILNFSNVEFMDQDTNDNVTFADATNQEKHMMPISLQQHNCKVRCTCPDFRWTFSTQDQAADALFGPGPELYQNKTDKAPRNPSDTVGVCKHIIKLAIELKNSGMLTTGGQQMAYDTKPEETPGGEELPNDVENPEIDQEQELRNDIEAQKPNTPEQEPQI